MKTFRQGDICFVKVKEMSKDVVKCEPQLKDAYIFAYGETAGACHQVYSNQVEVYGNNVKLDEANDVFVKVPKSAEIIHFKPSGTQDKHGNLELKEGLYKMKRQREYINGMQQRRLD